ncbi:alpha-ketoacid dehydrogenase subunit beta [Fodinicurvata sp. EGI_FJ10296]|uniref:alpha-ketoacid dehydrogenase subunit beta n=1 Tax=Fodinicurvata sp. EGI_FJ10296 TaxID=3231908 RepID=UPI00345236BA
MSEKSQSPVIRTAAETEPFETTYREALGMALADAMVEDEKVVVMGEEVGRYGGAYGVTRGLYERFGADRVIDTPISEPGIVGAAVGAAMTGLRPVAELMYVDFIAMSMDQLGNQAAKIRYMFGGQTGVPMVLRTQGGTGRSAGAQHSQSLEAWIMHTPGLHLAMPATVNDAYHLLRHAMSLPDPVVFIEHKGLYTSKGMLDRTAPDAPWGKSVIRRPGTDLWIITYSRMLHYAEQAAKDLADEGISAGVIDLRTLHPIDLDTVEQAVSATGRAMVVSEGVSAAGVASELAAAIQERCFDFLEEPVLRVAAENVPIPVSPALEAASIPSVPSIADAARRLTRHRSAA